MDRPPGTVPAPDEAAEPDGFVVLVDDGDRIHFLDWGGRSRPEGAGVLLVHGLAQTAWTWAPVARRARGAVPTVAMDLRGHGLSDAPTSGYDPATLAGDAVAVAEGSGLLAGPDDRVVLAGLGFGAVVAAWAARALGARCAGVVLVDGGWEDLEAATGMDADEFLRGLDEPPEVLRSMAAFLADRRGFDPGSWDADQERAARATVVETHAGRVVPVTRPHVVEAVVRAMFDHDPLAVLPGVAAPLAAFVATDDEGGSRRRALAAVSDARERAGRGRITVTAFPGEGHNLPRYRPDELTAAILGLAGAPVAVRDEPAAGGGAD